MYHSEEQEWYHMTTPKGTPTTGEWHFVRGVGQYFKVIGDKKLAHVWCLGDNYAQSDDYPYGPEAKANARLMAAAPELLEALEELYYQTEDFNNVNPDTETLEKAKQAIKKAKGE
jgi:hypothetical protein